MIIIPYDGTPIDDLITGIAAAMLNIEMDAYVCDRTGAARRDGRGDLLGVGGGFNVHIIDGIEYSVRGGATGFIAAVAANAGHVAMILAIRGRLESLRRQMQDEIGAAEWSKEHTHNYVATRIAPDSGTTNDFEWKDAKDMAVTWGEESHTRWENTYFTIAIDYDGIIDTKTLEPRAGYFWKAGALSPANLTYRAKIVNPWQSFRVCRDHRETIRRVFYPTPRDVRRSAISEHVITRKIYEREWRTMNPYRFAPQPRGGRPRPATIVADESGNCCKCSTPLYDSIYAIRITRGDDADHADLCFCESCFAGEEREQSREFKKYRDVGAAAAGKTMLLRTIYPRTARDLIEAAAADAAEIDLALYFMDSPGVPFFRNVAPDAPRRGISSIADLLSQAKKIEREDTRIYIMRKWDD